LRYFTAIFEEVKQEILQAATQPGSETLGSAKENTICSETCAKANSRLAQSHG